MALLQSSRVPCWCQSSGRGCSCHLLGFCFGMAFTGCVIWSVFSFGCPVLLCASPVWKHGDLKEAKAFSQPQPDSKAQPRGALCHEVLQALMWWSKQQMTVQSWVWGKRVVSPCPEDERARAACGVDQAFAFWYLSRFRFFPLCISKRWICTISLTHILLKLWWLELSGSYRQIVGMGCEGFPVPSAF